MAEIAVGALIFALGVLFGSAVVQSIYSKIFNQDIKENDGTGVQ